MGRECDPEYTVYIGTKVINVIINTMLILICYSIFMCMLQTEASYSCWWGPTSTLYVSSEMIWYKSTATIPIYTPGVQGSYCCMSLLIFFFSLQNSMVIECERMRGRRSTMDEIGDLVEGVCACEVGEICCVAHSSPYPAVALLQAASWRYDCACSPDVTGVMLRRRLCMSELWSKSPLNSYCIWFVVGIFRSRSMVDIYCYLEIYYVLVRELCTKETQRWCLCHDESEHVGIRVLIYVPIPLQNMLNFCYDWSAVLVLKIRPRVNTYCFIELFCAPVLRICVKEAQGGYSCYNANEPVEVYYMLIYVSIPLQTMLDGGGMYTKPWKHGRQYQIGLNSLRIENDGHSRDTRTRIQYGVTSINVTCVFYRRLSYGSRPGFCGPSAFCMCECSIEASVILGVVKVQMSPRNDLVFLMTTPNNTNDATDFLWFKCVIWVNCIYVFICIVKCVSCIKIGRFVVVSNLWQYLIKYGVWINGK